MILLTRTIHVSVLAVSTAGTCKFMKTPRAKPDLLSESPHALPCSRSPSLRLLPPRTRASSAWTGCRGVRTPEVGGRELGWATHAFEFAPSGGAGMGAPRTCGTTPTGAGRGADIHPRQQRHLHEDHDGRPHYNRHRERRPRGVQQQPAPCRSTIAVACWGWWSRSRTNLFCARRKETMRHGENPSRRASTAPTVTADQAVAPDGTTTADRVQIPATGATTADAPARPEHQMASGDASCPVPSTRRAPRLATCRMVGQWFGRRGLGHAPPCAQHVTLDASRTLRETGTRVARRYHQLRREPAAQRRPTPECYDMLLWGMEGKGNGLIRHQPHPDGGGGDTRGERYRRLSRRGRPSRCRLKPRQIAYTDADAEHHQQGFRAAPWPTDQTAGRCRRRLTRAVGRLLPTRLVGYNDGTTASGVAWNGVAVQTQRRARRLSSPTTEALGPQRWRDPDRSMGIVNRPAWSRLIRWNEALDARHPRNHTSASYLRMCWRLPQASV